MSNVVENSVLAWNSKKKAKMQQIKVFAKRLYDLRNEIRDETDQSQAVRRLQDLTKMRTNANKHYLETPQEEWDVLPNNTYLSGLFFYSEHVCLEYEPNNLLKTSRVQAVVSLAFDDSTYFKLQRNEGSIHVKDLFKKLAVSYNYERNRTDYPVRHEGLMYLFQNENVVDLLQQISDSVPEDEQVSLMQEPLTQTSMTGLGSAFCEEEFDLGTLQSTVSPTAFKKDDIIFKNKRFSVVVQFVPYMITNDPYTNNPENVSPTESQKFNEQIAKRIKTYMLQINLEHERDNGKKCLHVMKVLPTHRKCPVMYQFQCDLKTDPAQCMTDPVQAVCYHTSIGKRTDMRLHETEIMMLNLRQKDFFDTTTFPGTLKAKFNRDFDWDIYLLEYEHEDQHKVIGTLVHYQQGERLQPLTEQYMAYIDEKVVWKQKKPEEMFVEHDKYNIPVVRAMRNTSNDEIKLLHSTKVETVNFDGNYDFAYYMQVGGFLVSPNEIDFAWRWEEVKEQNLKFKFYPNYNTRDDNGVLYDFSKPNTIVPIDSMYFRYIPHKDFNTVCQVFNEGIIKKKYNLFVHNKKLYHMETFENRKDVVIHDTGVPLGNYMFILEGNQRIYYMNMTTIDKVAVAVTNIYSDCEWLYGNQGEVSNFIKYKNHYYYLSTERFFRQCQNQTFGRSQGQKSQDVFVTSPDKRVWLHHNKHIVEIFLLRENNIDGNRNFKCSGFAIDPWNNNKLWYIDQNAVVTKNIWWKEKITTKTDRKVWEYDYKDHMFRLFVSNKPKKEEQEQEKILPSSNFKDVYLQLFENQTVFWCEQKWGSRAKYMSCVSVKNSNNNNMQLRCTDKNNGQRYAFEIYEFNHRWTIKDNEDQLFYAIQRDPDNSRNLLEDFRDEIQGLYQLDTTNVVFEFLSSVQSAQKMRSVPSVLMPSLARYFKEPYLAINFTYHQKTEWNTPLVSYLRKNSFLLMPQWSFQHYLQFVCNDAAGYKIILRFNPFEAHWFLEVSQTFGKTEKFVSKMRTDDYDDGNSVFQSYVHESDNKQMMRSAIWQIGDATSLWTSTEIDSVKTKHKPHLTKPLQNATSVVVEMQEYSLNDWVQKSTREDEEYGQEEDEEDDIMSVVDGDLDESEASAKTKKGETVEDLEWSAPLLKHYVSLLTSSTQDGYFMFGDMTLSRIELKEINEKLDIVDTMYTLHAANEFLENVVIEFKVTAKRSWRITFQNNNQTTVYEPLDEIEGEMVASKRFSPLGLFQKRTAPVEGLVQQKIPMSKVVVPENQASIETGPESWLKEWMELKIIHKTDVNQTPRMLTDVSNDQFFKVARRGYPLYFYKSSDSSDGQYIVGLRHVIASSRIEGHIFSDAKTKVIITKYTFNAWRITIGGNEYISDFKSNDSPLGSYSEKYTLALATFSQDVPITVVSKHLEQVFLDPLNKESEIEIRLNTHDSVHSNLSNEKFIVKYGLDVALGVHYKNSENTSVKVTLLSRITSVRWVLQVVTQYVSDKNPKSIIFEACDQNGNVDSRSSFYGFYRERNVTRPAISISDWQGFNPDLARKQGNDTSDIEQLEEIDLTNIDKLNFEDTVFKPFTKPDISSWPGMKKASYGDVPYTLKITQISKTENRTFNNDFLDSMLTREYGLSIEDLDEVKTVTGEYRKIITNKQEHLFEKRSPDPKIITKKNKTGQFVITTTLSINLSRQSPYWKISKYIDSHDDYKKRANGQNHFDALQYKRQSLQERKEAVLMQISKRENKDSINGEYSKQGGDGARIEIFCDFEYLIPKTWMFTVQVEDPNAASEWIYSKSRRYEKTVWSGVYEQASWNAKYQKKHVKLESQMQYDCYFIVNSNVNEIEAVLDMKNERNGGGIIKTYVYNKKGCDNMLGVYKRYDLNNKDKVIGVVIVKNIKSNFFLRIPDETNLPNTWKKLEVCKPHQKDHLKKLEEISNLSVPLAHRFLSHAFSLHGACVHMMMDLGQHVKPHQVVLSPGPRRAQKQKTANNQADSKQIMDRLQEIVAVLNTHLGKQIS